MNRNCLKYFTCLHSKLRLTQLPALEDKAELKSRPLLFNNVQKLAQNERCSSVCSILSFGGATCQAHLPSKLTAICRNPCKILFHYQRNYKWQEPFFEIQTWQGGGGLSSCLLNHPESSKGGHVTHCRKFSYFRQSTNCLNCSGALWCNAANQKFMLLNTTTLLHSNTTPTPRQPFKS